jgi:hypothetical protein
MNATLLLDYDNVYPTSATAPTLELVTHDLSEMMMLATRSQPGTKAVHVRVYGGWTEGGTLTRRASEVLQTLPTASFFPLIGAGGTIVGGTVGLAHGLALHPEFTLGDTYVRRLGPPQVRLQRAIPAGCVAGSDHCPARILRAFTYRGNRRCPVDGCNVQSSDAFVTHEQKMVDGLMACDLLGLSRLGNPGEDTVGIVTSDRDLLPAVVAAAQMRSASVAVIALTGGWHSPDIDVIRAAGADYFGEEEIGSGRVP